MNRRNVEVDFLEKIQEITGIQVFSSVDLQYMNAEDLKKERCVSRTLTTEIVEKYKKEHDEENNRVYEQINIYKNTISFVFIGDSKHIQKVQEFFEHIQGRGWWIARNGFKYVIENVGSIIDISTALPAGYIEKNVMDIAVRVQESSITKIPLVKKVDYKIGGIANVRDNKRGGKGNCIS